MAVTASAISRVSMPSAVMLKPVCLNAWTRAGTWTGKILANVGGRVEPIIRANPFAGADAVKPKDYKESTWYKKLDKGSRAILDAAIKAKREELGGDNLE